MLEYKQKHGRSWSKMNFRMVSGDFAELAGHWVVARDPKDPQNSMLRYEIVFLPISKALIPSALRHFLVKQVLPNNIMALAAYAERVAKVSSRPSPPMVRGTSTTLQQHCQRRALYAGGHRERTERWSRVVDGEHAACSG
jgi:hypothetical protein